MRRQRRAISVRIHAAIRLNSGKDAAYLNRKYKDDPDFSPIAPIYDEEDVIKALERFVGMPISPHVLSAAGCSCAEFYNAGHILGSSEAVLTVEENGTRRTILFSGDLGRKGLPIIRDPEYPPLPVDYVVMESTYGNRVHGSILQMEDDLERVIKTVRRGGKVIVPAFAVGRTQELLALHSLSTQHRIPPIPVFIDSPLAINVARCLSSIRSVLIETRAFLSAHGEVFDYSQVRFVSSREESLRLNDLKGSAIIISRREWPKQDGFWPTCETTWKMNAIMILIVGFMAQHTLGRRRRAASARKIWGVERDLHARVEVMNSFSAHADRRDLLEFARRCGTETRTFFLVHGEPEAQNRSRTEMTQKATACAFHRAVAVISLE